VDETEEHLFLKCHVFLLTREALETTLKQLTGPSTDVERAVTLNTLPGADPQKTTRAFRLLAEFRRLVWTLRNADRYEKRNHTPDAVKQV
jgi:hypothetical protein